MKSLQEFKTVPFLIASGIAILVPLLALYLLKVDASLLSFYALIFLKLGLTIVATFHKRRTVRRISGILSSLALFFFGLLVIAGIIMTPLSTFKIWFAAFFQGDHGGIISNLFFLIISFFTALFSSLVIGKNSISVLTGLLAVLLGTMTLITQNIVFGIIFSVSLVIFIFAYIRSGVIFSVIIIVVCFLIGLVFWGQSPQPQGNEFISKTLHYEIRRLVNRTIPTFPLAIGIPGYGYTMGIDDTIGERPLLSPIPVFGINGTIDNYEYLATEHLDTFTGNQWYVSSEQLHIFNSRKPAGISIPSDAKHGLTVDILVDSFLYLPHTPDATYALVNNIPVSLELKLAERAVACDPVLLSGDSITLFSTPRETNTGMDLRERYLTLPGNLSREVRNLAAQFKNELDDPAQTAAGIQMYLSAEYTYSLEAPGAPAGTSVLDHFLFKSQSGFCEHFATAFVLLARLSGIPSRYVRGYLVAPPEESLVTQDYTIVTGLSAHAWAEIWVYGKGWITVETTPPFIDDTMAINRLITGDDYTVSQLEALRRIRRPRGESFPWIPFPFITDLGTAIISGVVVLCLILIFSAALLVRLLTRKMNPCHHAKDLLARYIKAGSRVALPGEITWSGWADRIRQKAPEIARKIDTLEDAILRVAYSGAKPARRDLLYMNLLLPRLRRKLRKYRCPDRS